MRLAFSLIFTLSLLFLLVACGGESATPTPQPTPEPTPTPIDPLPEPRLMAWAGDEVVLLGSNGVKESLLSLPDNTVRVRPCGERSTSSDGTHFAFYVGGTETGVLHQITDDDVVQPIADVHTLACTGMGSFAYGDERLGFIDFLGSVGGTNFPLGELHLVDLTGNPIARHENAGAFDFSGETTAFISGFPNSDGDVTEVGVFRLDSADATSVEVSTLFSDEDCRFANSGITIIDTTQYIVVMGQSCPGGSEWQLYRIDAEANRATRELSGAAGGGFYADTRILSTFAAPSGLAFYFSYPNGWQRDRADLKSVMLSDVQDADPIVRFGVMPGFVTPTALNYDPDANALPAVSYDGRWVAVVSKDADSNTNLNLLDLNVPDLPPIVIPVNDVGDSISSLAFTLDSQRLLFVSGGYDGENNALFAVDLNSTSDERIIRGRFAEGIRPSPDIPFVALAQWSIENESRKLEVVAVRLDSAQSEVVYTGASDELVYLLSWR